MSDSEPLASTTLLLRQYRDGSGQARDQLVERYLPLLRQWAHGRMPTYRRDLAETDDLVQVTFLRALNRLEQFRSERPGAFLAYLRTVLINLVREEIRRKKRRPDELPISDTQLADQASSVEQMVGSEILEAYEDALAAMDEEKRAAVIMRVEFGMTYQEIASELERSSANGTRMMIARALAELAEAMPE